MLQYAVGLSVVFSFILTEAFGLYTGGMISAGYLAFYVAEPLRLLSTALLAAAIHGLIGLLSTRLILFGRRRFMVAILLGILLGAAVDRAFFSFGIPQDLRVIGNLIPGLIANDMHRQGLWKTVLGLAVCTALVKLALYLGVLL